MVAGRETIRRLLLGAWPDSKRERDLALFGWGERLEQLDDVAFGVDSIASRVAGEFLAVGVIEPPHDAMALPVAAPLTLYAGVRGSSAGRPPGV